MDVCLITGTSTGIGEAATLSFARAGYRVYATMRNLAKSGPLKEAAAAEDLPVTVIQLDVTDQDSIAQAVSEVIEAEGRIDVLVNNAGLGAACPVETYPEDEHRVHGGVLRQLPERPSRHRHVEALRDRTSLLLLGVDDRGHLHVR